MRLKCDPRKELENECKYEVGSAAADIRGKKGLTWAVSRQQGGGMWEEGEEGGGGVEGWTGVGGGWRGVG
ncbi:hypothetical protein HaLaN_08653 [Haematococcus lacustris]|uniref:Uncharacterized protein n=1 Tax=Haematococcus lacustris TaxID=44745 RepID=A0A699ZBP9_HAELA|nr:hypothetical protein HaLaN_08653 [Haematococcus lacustris]